MSAPIKIVDSKTGNSARVTNFGQVVTSPLDYSTPVERELDVPLQVFNFISPVASKDIVITDIIVSANKDVSTNTPADISIYEADAVDSATPSPGIIRPQLVRAQNFSLTGLNILVPRGKWLNAFTSDATIILTIMFYRVPI